ncbi:MAG: SPFH domain-containing protein [Blautia sp.]
MGLIKAGLGALSGTMADQWKEFFYCESIDNDVLAVKGQKRTSKRSSNNKGSDNIITSGSGIAVADGQCMMIVEQGKIVDICAEPGEYTYDASTEPSIFSGDLGSAIKNTFQTIGKRFTYGGDTGKDQRVYYFNTKELVDNKFGTPNPIPFRVVDQNIGLDIDVSVRCSGVYSFRIADPLLFYANVCGNFEQQYDKEQISGQLKTEFISALQPAFANISQQGIRPSALPAHAMELCDAMNQALTQKWSQIRGLVIVSVAMNPITLPEEDAQMIKEAQRMAMLRNPAMAAATLVGAQADAMKTAAGNSAGAMTGFMGMNMANTAGGLNVQNLYAMGQQPTSQPQMQQPTPQPQMQQAPAQPAAAPSAGQWKCSCGAMVSGNFCPNCGSKKPEDTSWTCSCGAVNTGRFCSNCGSPKPAIKAHYRCDKCGWEPEDSTNPPKFCPNCGDPFNSNDMI